MLAGWRLGHELRPTLFRRNPLRGQGRYEPLDFYSSRKQSTPPSFDLFSMIGYTTAMFPGHGTSVLLTILSFALTGSLLASTPTIRSLSVEGNTAFTSREIPGWLSSREGLLFNPAILRNDLQVIQDTYRRQGYYSMCAESDVAYDTDSTRVEITIRIAEGRQSVIGGLRIGGMSVLTGPEVLALFDTKTGRPLDREMLERDVEALLRRYEQAGYPFTTCVIAEVSHRQGEETDFIDVVLEVNEGTRLTIDEIRVTGNTETDASVVVRETRIAFGEVFNPAKLESIRQRLQRLNIFADVREPELYVRNQSGGLLIAVKEGNTNTFDGVIGYIPGPTEGESGYLTGLASVSMRNLFGTGRKLSIRWQREDRSSQELGLRYLEPWVFGFPANVGGGFFQRKQDTTYVRRVFDMKGELMLTDEISIGLLFGSESVIPSDSLSTRALRSSTVSLGGELLYDSRDELYSPTSGARYRTDYQYGAKRISTIPASLVDKVKSKAAVQRFGVDLDFFVTTFTRQVLAIGLHGRELRSGELEESEMFRFGGARTLRGYREGQFLGSRVAWSNAEYRFLLARRSFFYGFVDTGYYLRPADELREIPRADAFKLGYGVGLQVETGLGLMGVSFALGEGDAFTNGKIHFGLINEF